MGEEIGRIGFSREDMAQFKSRLVEETVLARKLLADDKDGRPRAGHTLGFEIEAWIVDHNSHPAAINQELLETLSHPLVAPELSRFNIELNFEPLALDGDVLDRAAGILSRVWGICNDEAHRLGASIVMIGTLPTIRGQDLTLANMSPLNRFFALHRQVLRLRGGRASKVDISGDDRFVSGRSDVMLDAATTSLQIHIGSPKELAHLYYNASIAISGPVLAASGNAPFLFAKALWEETRIPLLEQALEMPGPPRVGMGLGYVGSSLIELFEENARSYPILLPMSFDAAPSELRHLRLHNGTIWRWNRPLIGFDGDGVPRLRIEHRILPSGPTITDMIANTALYLGLARHLAMSGGAGAGGLSFEDAVRNFQSAARHGLDAEMTWPGVGLERADRLLLDRLIPAARQGLRDLRVDDSSGWLDIIAMRVRTRQTGARWQRRALDMVEGDIYALMAAYCERQRSGAPVHLWEL